MDIQSLLTLLKNVEDRPEERFYMAVWHTPKLPSRQHCGSACCAIGTFCEANPTDKLKLAPRIDFKSTSLKPEINLHPQQVIDDKETAIGHAAIQFRLSISIRESLFLFGGGHLHNTLSAHSARSARSNHAINLSKPEFLNRLRKFIYYKLRS